MKVLVTDISKGGKNSEGYYDPTASIALAEVNKEQADADKRAYDLIKVLKYIIRHSGFELSERIQITDKTTGRKYK